MKFDLNILDILNLPVRILSALALASGFLLLFPAKFLNELHLNSFINKYGFIIGLVFIVSLAILIVTLIIQIFNFISNKRKLKLFYKTAEKRLRKLSPYEICIVLILFENKNHTNLLPINDGAVNRIENEMIVGKLTNQYMVSNPNTAKIPYLLQPWVVNELEGNSDLFTYFENTAEAFIEDDNNKELIYKNFFAKDDYYF